MASGLSALILVSCAEKSEVLAAEGFGRQHLDAEVFQRRLHHVVSRFRERVVAAVHHRDFLDAELLLRRAQCHGHDVSFRQRCAEHIRSDSRDTVRRCRGADNRNLAAIGDEAGCEHLVRQRRTEDQRNLLRTDQLPRAIDRLLFIARQVLVCDLQGAPVQNAAGLIDLFQGKVEAVLDRDAVFVVRPGQNLDGADGDGLLGLRESGARQRKRRAQNPNGGN